MPNIYLDRGFMKAVYAMQDRLERKAEGDVMVTERRALYEMLDSDAVRRVDKQRDRQEGR